MLRCKKTIYNPFFCKQCKNVLLGDSNCTAMNLIRMISFSNQEIKVCEILRNPATKLVWTADLKSCFHSFRIQNTGHKIMNLGRSIAKLVHTTCLESVFHFSCDHSGEIVAKMIKIAYYLRSASPTRFNVSLN